MKTEKLLDEVLHHLRMVRDDGETLQKILDFIESEIQPYREEREEEIEIPVRYTEIVHQIADNLSAGLISFFNPDTLQIDWCHPSMPNEPEDDDEDVSPGETDFDYLSWENYLMFKPLHSSESFAIMETFARQLKDENTTEKMLNILSRGKPFSHFNEFIHTSEYREDWFSFRQKQLENYVKQLILEYLENNKNYRQN
ncbi:MAG: hypothetical protein JJE08_04680 [Proteiniphilum sp.]|nr:hypothetical protein [Proteiniphilum sp.]